MVTLLNVQSSPNLSSSVSREVSGSFIEAYVASHPGVAVDDLDLAVNQPSHVGADHLGAFFALPETHTEAHMAALKTSDNYVDQLLAADIIVIGTPMHNFAIASVLKSWIDNIVRAGKTFKYTDDNISSGLLRGKRLVIILGAGGIYSDGPFKQYDFATTYLQGIFSFLGVSDIIVIRAEGSALGPESASAGLAAAKTAAVAAAA
jgi:FMN-dependent NADH-azoreductase